MDRIIDENFTQNQNPNQKVFNNRVHNNERRVLAPILSKSSNLLTRPQTKQQTKPSKGLQTREQKGRPKAANGTTSAVAKANEEANVKAVQSVTTFEIFCDSLDSDNNLSNNENNYVLEDIKEDMDSCETTDHLLSERTENSLTIDIDEELVEAFSEQEIRCEETIEIGSEDEDEELEDASASEQTSETSRSFDKTSLSRCREYANEIHKYLISYERRLMADPFYVAKQPEINAKMRSILIDWLVEVTEEYKLLDQTLFLAVNYIDRFLSLMSVSRQSFQLLGTASLFIGAKYEEIYPPELSEFVYITDDSYTKQQILNMEQLVLKALDFEVSAPTTYYFIEKLSSDLELEPIVKHLAKYLCHLTLLESEPFLRFYPSEIAVCAVILSAQTLGFRTLLTNEFFENSISYEKQLKSGNVKHFLVDRQNCMEALHRMHAFAHKHPQQAIQTKFMSDKYYRVSVVEPMTSSPRIY